jgi:penicillin amidase
MRKLPLFIWGLLCIGLIYFLNNPLNQIPALGKLLSPSHGFWQQMEGRLPELPTEVAIENLEKPVDVVWDSLLIPHIFAENDADLYFVQGYITASMRLWQMDFQTRAAAGRIAEVVGEAAIEFDQSMRRKGMALGAQKSLEANFKNEAVNVAFERYADGINAYISTLNSRTLPLEYKILGMQPEPWSAYRSMLLLEYMANMLNTHNNDIEYTNFLEQYGYGDWQMLYGGRDDKTEPIVNAPGMWQFPPKPGNVAATDIVSAPKDLVDHAKPNPDNGSNNWAVSPQKSATGHALLANDPHLSLNLPALWFVAHLNSGSLNTMGASLPGTPGIIIGFNENIAWGVTNAQRDLVDWYQVEFTDASRTAILVDGKTQPIERLVEEIKVKGGSSIYDTLYASSFGIIANYATMPQAPNKAWAYRWIGQEPSETALALYLINRGKNLDDYMAAADHFDSPAQNIIYADVAGTIGIRVQGKYPVRQPNEGLFLRDGTTQANAWNDYIPNRHNVSIFNPEWGFVSSANQYPADSTYPYFIAATQYESYRNRRINQVLRADTSVTIADMMALHNDNYNLEASENLNYWLSTLTFNSLTADEKEVFNRLINWNYFANADVPEPMYYDAWREAILEFAWDELLYEEKPMTAPSAYRTFALLRQQNELPWWDMQSTTEKENGEKLIRAAFAEATNRVAAWQEAKTGTETAHNWGNYKATRITHLTRQMALSRQNVFIGGNRGIVNATSQTHGPSWRQIVELDPAGVKAWGIYPGGQSGNPGSAFYTNWVDGWAKGQYHRLDILATPSTLTYEKSIQTTTFNPAKE